MSFSRAGIPKAIAGLDAWLDTMHGPDGYGGPVTHWWRNCLQYTGGGLDWRCEGIITGYLNLYRGSREEGWLVKARRAADDVVRGQLPGGNFRNSSLEENPYAGGTPGEAACDVALLDLAQTLHDEGDPCWRIYLTAAERNVRGYCIAQLWYPETATFCDNPRIPSFVPNKAATLVKALVWLARLSGDEEVARVYAVPTLEAILAHQVTGGPLDGAIHQGSARGRLAARFFPLYIARCVPGLVAGYEWALDARYLDAARRAMRFVVRQRYEDGSFPQVTYPGGRVNRYPQWVAGAGDILRAHDILRPYGLDADSEPTLEWLLHGQEPTGAFRMARGFASQISQREPGPLPEFRDILPVAAWNSMAFGYLTRAVWTADRGRLTAGEWHGLHSGISDVSSFEAVCTFRRRAMRYREDATSIELRQNSRTLYRWQKGARWAEICPPELWWK